MRLQERLHLDVDGLKEAMHEKLAVRRSGMLSLEGEEGEEGEGEGRSRRAASPSAAEAAVAAPAGAPAAGLAVAADGGDSSRANGLVYATGDLSEQSEQGDLAEPSTIALSDELYVKVLPAYLVVVRLQLAMLALSTHALVKRLLFSGQRGRRSFWSYTHVDDEVSLILDEGSLEDFPDEALVGGSSTR